MDFCPVCETRLVSGVCRRCNPVYFQELPYKRWLTWMKSQYAAGHVVGPYSCEIYYPKKWNEYLSPFSQNIIRAKQGSKEAANYLCEKMYDYLLQNKSPSRFFTLDDVEIIVPVPNEKCVLKDATLIAEEFAKIIRERVRKNIRSGNIILERVAKSDPYRKTSSHADKYNSSLQDYKVNKKLKEYMLKNGIKNILKNKKILLIDDNSTSGITIGVCSTRLLQLGAKQVIMFCAGRTYGASVPYLPSGT